jgi:hypothetical protein
MIVVDNDQISVFFHQDDENRIPERILTRCDWGWRDQWCGTEQLSLASAVGTDVTAVT